MASVERLDASQWARLRAIRLRALRDEPDAFGSSLEREHAYGEAQWRELLEAGPWWLATDGDADVGIVAGGHHREHRMPWVFSMWVASAARGTGLAEALLGEVVAWARDEEHAPSLGLDVADRVPRAQRFYERYGFVVTEVSFPMPRDPTITLVEMALDLSGG